MTQGKHPFSSERFAQIVANGLVDLELLRDDERVHTSTLAAEDRALWGAIFLAAESLAQDVVQQQARVGSAPSELLPLKTRARRVLALIACARIE